MAIHFHLIDFSYRIIDGYKFSNLPINNDVFSLIMPID